MGERAGIYTPLTSSLCCLQGSLVVGTLCTGACAKTKTHKEEGGVLRGVVSVCLHCFLLCTVPLFLCFLAKLGVDLATNSDLCFNYEEHGFSAF